MKRNRCIFLVCLLLAVLLAVPAHADTGPKPSVRLSFTGAEGMEYYVTLLSEQDRYGPNYAYRGTNKQDGGNEAIWEKFVNYEDADGFYFLQEWRECTESHSFLWGYYPPNPFKVLVYFPAEDLFCVSPVYERYAFDSYYSVDLSNRQSGAITAERNYDYFWEVFSLWARIVITILVELGVALLFGYRERRLLWFLLEVNVVTQVVLNVALNVANYRSGAYSFVFTYVLAELAVLALESVLYAVRFPTLSEKPQSRQKVLGYAFLANLTSFAAGLGIAHLIPGIF